MTRPRVISLVPSITETLVAWDVDVVACTRFCEQPRLRHVGGTKNPDIAAIVGLGPDTVFMDTEENRREDAEELRAAGVHVVATEVHALVDVPAALDLLAAVCGVEVDVTDLGRVVAHGVPVEGRRTAVVPIWRRPWMAITSGTYGGSLLAALGVDVVPRSDDLYPVIEPGDLDADLVLVPSEPYEFTDAHLVELAAAMPGAEIRRIDGQDLFWWGVRTAGALKRLDAALSGAPGTR